MNKIKEILSKTKLDYILLLNSDKHFNEFLSEDNCIIQKISNFSGSNAKVILNLKETSKNILFTDSRYSIQAKNQLNNDWIVKSDNEFKDTLKEIDKTKRIGIDPSTMSNSFYENYIKNLNIEHIDLFNLLDLSTTKSNEKLIYLPIKYSGEHIKDKLNKIKSYITQQEYFISKTGFSLVVTKLDEIAWLLNHRFTSDTPCNPLFSSYLVVNYNKETDKVLLDVYLSKDKYSAEGFKENIESELDCELRIHDYAQFEEKLIPNMDIKDKENHIIITSSYINIQSYSLLKNTNVKLFSTKYPIIDMIKATKNTTEINGMKMAHLQDGACLLKLIFWLSSNLKFNITEYDVACKLLEIRKQHKDFQIQSFDTISSYGTNSAVVHYRPESYSSKTLYDKDIFLLDSGAHFIYGTTDTTRVFHFGQPTDKMRRLYTRVLQGNIMLERAILDYNKDDNAIILDSIARQFIRRENLDYGHGTGHGVGCFLNVHEGPVSISPQSSFPIKENMIFSNEPGCYIENEFGIRIENLLLSRKEANKLKFENITLFPYWKNLIEKDLLSSEDINYINTYHEKVFTSLSSIVNKDKEIVEYLGKITDKL